MAKAKAKPDPRAEARKALAKPSVPVFERSVSDVREIEARSDFAVTSAQNNTPVDLAFLAALKHWTNDRDGKLLVRAIRYKNPTSRKDPQEEELRGDERYWWDDAVSEYLIDNEIRLNEHLILPHTWIQATASDPLASLESRSKDASAIYGHSQLAMKAVATPHQRLPKILYTTGSVTKKNYSKTKAGDLAAFHHSPSAVLVEIRGKRFHLREVSWDGVCFYDLDRIYTAEGSAPAPPASALVTGDEHAWFNCPAVRLATYDANDSIVRTLRPAVLVRHDLFDCYSVTPHHQKRRLTRAVKTVNGWGSLERELDDTRRFMEATTPEGVLNVITGANHHDQLFRFLQSGEQNVEPENLALYYWFNWRLLAEAKMTPNGVQHPDPFELYCRDRGLLCDARFLGPDESFVVAGVELGMHGHLGPNGARGTVRNLSKIGLRSVVGHSHSPGIYQGAYQVGTSTHLRLEYNAGPSSWLNTHAAVYPNGRRQMLHVIDGHWRG